LFSLSLSPLLQIEQEKENAREKNSNCCCVRRSKSRLLNDGSHDEGGKPKLGRMASLFYPLVRFIPLIFLEIKNNFLTFFFSFLHILVREE